MSVGGMWGSNPRHAPPKIRFRNLLYFSRLTNQFTIIFAPIWDNFGTLFEILGKGFCSTYLSEFQCVISIAGITRGKVLGKGFPDWVLPKLFLACLFRFNFSTTHWSLSNRRKLPVTDRVTYSVCSSAYWLSAYLLHLVVNDISQSCSLLSQSA